MQASPCRTLQIVVSPPSGKSKRKAAPRSSSFHDYQPPPLPVRKSKPAEPPKASEPAPSEPKVDDESVETAVHEAEDSAKKMAEKKKRRERRHYAPPAIDKPSRLKLPEPNYDDLPRHGE